MESGYRSIKRNDAQELHKSSRFGRTVAFSIGVVIASCSPMVDSIPIMQNVGIANAQPAPSQSGQPVQAPASPYNPLRNPFETNQRIRDVAGGLSGSVSSKAQGIFDKLNIRAANGASVMDGTGRPPRTAVETLAQGGDCSELATLVISVMKEAGIPGGAKIVHFPSAPVDEDHMVPYIIDGDKQIIIDLQAGTLGATAQGTPTVIMNLTLDQAGEMYHREWGDDLRDRNNQADALKAYKRSVEVYDRDAYVHQNLGILYEKDKKMDLAAKHFKKAAELNPARYAKDKKRGSYNEELQKGEKAYKEKNWSECVTHFQNALDSGEKISNDEKSAIQAYIDVCKKKMNP